MRIVATSDVDSKTLQTFIRNLNSEFDVEIDEERVAFLSAEPPSWIIFLADINWWLKGFGFMAALYIAELVKEAGKSTWKSVASRVTVSKDDKVKKLSENFADLRTQVAKSTKLEIGVPFPDDHFPTRLTLSSTEPTSIAVEIGLFLHHLPKLQALIEEENLTADTVATGIFLKLTPEGSLEVSWFDSDSLQKEVRNLPL